MAKSHGLDSLNEKEDKAKLDHKKVISKALEESLSDFKEHIKSLIADSVSGAYSDLIETVKNESLKVHYNIEELRAELHSINQRCDELEKGVGIVGLDQKDCYKDCQECMVDMHQHLLDVKNLAENTAQLIDQTIEKDMENLNIKLNTELKLKDKEIEELWHRTESCLNNSKDDLAKIEELFAVNLNHTAAIQINSNRIEENDISNQRIERRLMTEAGRLDKVQESQKSLENTVIEEQKTLTSYKKLIQELHNGVQTLHQDAELLRTRFSDEIVKMRTFNNQALQAIINDVKLLKELKTEHIEDQIKEYTKGK